MAVISYLDQLTPDEGVVLTIGKLDGVHLGHQHLVKQVVHRADALGIKSAVITLHPHPLEVLAPQQQILYLTTLDERLNLLAELGLDLVIVQPFTAEVANTPARQFVAELCRHVRLRELWVGPDFALGHNREGDALFLRQLGREWDFAVYVVEPLVVDGRMVSGTQIRQLISDGQVAKAARLLGRLPRLHGEVVRGAERGRTLGFPTANIEVADRLLVPKNGVYAVQVWLGDERLDGVTNIGVRPSFDGGERVVEVHILDFDHLIYGQRLDVAFVERLRDERRFNGVDELVAQIQRDVERARQILGTMKDQHTRFEELEHTADVALRIFGEDLEELFENAAWGMFSLLTDPSQVTPNTGHEIELEAMDVETLLVDWLSELLYLHETEEEVYSEFAFDQVTSTTLKARVRGDKVDDIRKDIKAVTYHGLVVQETPAGYEATVVFDI